MNEQDKEIEVSFRAETGELYSLDKKQRILLKAVLRLTLTTPSGRKQIMQRFGKEGFKVAVNLLEQMGVKVETPV